jgi:hypothetical protein
MQPRRSSSTVQPLSKSRVPAMAADAGGLGPSYAPGVSYPVWTRSLSREAQQQSAEKRAGRAVPRAGTGRGPYAPCWTGPELSAAATPGVKRSRQGWCNPLVGKWTRRKASGPPSESREGRRVPQE